MSVYKGTARQDGRFWYVEVDGVGATQARHLREVDDMAADLVASMLDRDVEGVVVDIKTELPDEVAASISESARLRRVAAEANAESALLSRKAARDLRARGLPVRDVGKALGVSYQRAHQLVSDD